MHKAMLKKITQADKRSITECVYIYTHRERESVLEHSQVEFGRIKTKTKKTLPIILCRK